MQAFWSKEKYSYLKLLNRLYVRSRGSGVQTGFQTHIVWTNKTAPHLTHTIAYIIMHIYNCNEKTKFWVHKVARVSLSTDELLPVFKPWVLQTKNIATRE